MLPRWNGSELQVITHRIIGPGAKNMRSTVRFVGCAFGRIRHVVASWPGSTHDARVWRTSTARAAIETQNEFAIAGKSMYTNLHGVF